MLQIYPPDTYVSMKGKHVDVLLYYVVSYWYKILSILYTLESSFSPFLVLCLSVFSFYVDVAQIC